MTFLINSTTVYFLVYIVTSNLMLSTRLKIDVFLLTGSSCFSCPWGKKKINICFITFFYIFYLYINLQ